MKTNSSKRLTPLCKESIFFSAFKPSVINKIARECEFICRSDGKISPLSFVISFMRMVTKGLHSYAGWAMEISLELKTSLTKQALNERMNLRTENFLKRLFQYQFLQQSRDQVGQKWNKRFSNIYCEDCTHINLPQELAAYYPGNISRGKKKAVAKLHVLFNMSTNSFTMLNLHSFTQNDQGLAAVSSQHLKKGDLILRDLGFLVLSCLESFTKKGVYFLTRKSHSIKIYDPNSGAEIKLLKRLRKRGFIDQQVLAGSQKQNIRIIVLPVSQQHAAQRRRKAKNDRDKRLNHSAEYFHLLGYTILLTNIESTTCTARQALELYGLRWRIETLFKSWKSNLSIQRIIPSKCKNVHRINCIIYLVLIYILLFQRFYRQCSVGQWTAISPTKLSTFFRQHLQIIVTTNTFHIHPLLLKECFYEKRKDRQNAMEKLYKLAA